MSLFDRPTPKSPASNDHEPLAARMRPRTLDEFWGQSHILAKGRLLRRAIEADQLSSVIFYGPPGTGKTTLARIIANSTRSKFLSINAVLAGIKEIRESIEQAKQNFSLVNRKSILFVDEVHRFNKSQQDALLPWVENGTITLIGATTENPFFEVNKALVSRSRVFQLNSLTESDLRGIAMQALDDPDRGYGLLKVNMRDDALAHLVNVANGDARALLNALELAVTTTPPDESGFIDITLQVAEESIQQRAVLYDKEGDAHFDTISAFIKSVRGSDPDAALYWLARMVQAGESPNFIFRRLLISACEDIGMADPHAVSVVESCANAFDRIGLPEGRYHLAHATIYLATAPKSNSSMAFFDALSVVQKESSYDVPNPLKDASRDKDGLGHGQGYLYPHAYRDHWVAQQYLPDGLQGRIFYHPTSIGYEGTIAEKITRNREAQLALTEERPDTATTTSEERWIGRTFDGAASRAQLIRDEIFKVGDIQDNARVLDINAGSGLLTFEALRKCPNGGVFCITTPSQAADNFEALMSQKPELERATTARVQTITHDIISAFPNHEFDFITGRNFLHTCDDLPALIQAIHLMLASGGHTAIANVLPSAMPRINELIDASKQLDPHLVTAWKNAEDKLLQTEPGQAFSASQIETAAQKVGIDIHIRRIELEGSLTITPTIYSHWFIRNRAKPGYIDKLSQYLSEESCESIAQWANLYLKGQTVNWPTVILLISWQK
ncbi:MAG: AAA family ATPase [Proteobacteria bacterium]|nr:AAA family ATPase [Pseudomonadota bacterium]